MSPVALKPQASPGTRHESPLPTLADRQFLGASIIWLASALVYLFTILSVTATNNDFALIALGADLVNRGGLLYRDLHTVMFPGSYLWLALFFKAFGSSLAVCKTVALLTFTASACLLLALSRLLMAGWLAFLPATIFLIIGPPMCPFNSHHWDALMFYLLYCLFLAKLLTGKRAGSGLALAAGISAGLSIACLQNFLLAVAAGNLSAAWIHAQKTGSPLRSVRLLLMLTAATSVVPSLILLHAACVGTLPAMIDCTVGFVLNRYVPVNAVPYGYANFLPFIAGAFPPPWSAVAALPYYLIKAAPLVVAMTAAFYTVRAGNLSTMCRHKSTVVLLLALAFSLWLSEQHRPDIKRLFWGSQLLLILLSYFLELAASRSAIARRTLPAAVFILVLGLALNAARYLSLAHPLAPVYSTRRGAVKSLNDLRVVEDLQELTVPYEKVFVYPYDTAINFLSRTSFPSIFPFVHYRYHSPEQVESVIRDLERSQVRFVVWSRRIGNDTFNKMGFPAYVPLADSDCVVERYLKDNYEIVRSYDHYWLMKRRKESG